MTLWLRPPRCGRALIFDLLGSERCAAETPTPLHPLAPPDTNFGAAFEQTVRVTSLGGVAFRAFREHGHVPCHATQTDRNFAVAGNDGDEK